MHIRKFQESSAPPLEKPHRGTPEGHCGQTSEHAREIARESHRSIRKTQTTAASSYELEVKFSFYFNEVAMIGRKKRNLWHELYVMKALKI